MRFLDRIAQRIEADVVDITKRLKDKKASDKQLKKEQKVVDLQPKWDKAVARVATSSSYAGGYELQVRVPVPAEFIRDKKTDTKGDFVTQLHAFINEKVGKWMGQPTMDWGGQKRAKDGMLDVKAYWYFQDPFFAYALGLNLADWHGSAEVVDVNKIPVRLAKAEKAVKEMDDFKTLALKKLKLRSQDKEEQNKIWKEEFMEDFVKLTEKWAQEGISYASLKTGSRDKSKAFG